MPVTSFPSGCSLCQMRRLEQMTSRGPAVLPGLSLLTFQTGRRRFQQISEIKVWILSDPFKEHQQIFVNCSLLLPLFRESWARLMSQASMGHRGARGTAPPSEHPAQLEGPIMTRAADCNAGPAMPAPLLLSLLLCPVWGKGSTQGPGI